MSHKSFKVKSKVIEIATLGSNHHIEINPSDVGISDRHVVQEVIKEIAQTQNVATGGAEKGHAFKGQDARTQSSSGNQLQPSLECIR